jgi:hypothetical protein
MTFQQTSERLEHQNSGSPGALASFASDVAGSLLSPSETLRDIGERRAVAPALILVLLIAVIASMAQATLLILEVLRVPGFYSPVPQMVTAPLAAFQLMSLMWNLVWIPVFWTLLAAMVYGVTWLLGGRGSFMSLWAATGFAMAPQLLVAPFSSATEMLGIIGGGSQFLGLLITIPLVMGAFVWTLALLVIAIRETMAVSTGRAIGSLATLFGVVMAFGLLIVCAFMLVVAAIIGAAAA